MKSRTSFFNPTAFKKTITRFAPVWVLYTVFLLLVLFGIQSQKSYYMARDIIELMNVTCWGNLIYAAIVALYLFGDLYNGRLCNALHAFPTRREGWLTIQIVAGILFSLVPNLLLTVITGLQLGEYSYIVWIWLAVAMLQYLFFFGTATLSALCAGNRLGMVANYGILHFIVVLLLVLAKLLYEPLLYGVEISEQAFYQAFPLYQMMELGYVNKGYASEMTQIIYMGLNADGWRHLTICVAVGIGCMLLSVLVYRRRHLERAGDFITVKPIEPVFLVIYTVAMGAVFYAFSEVIGTPSYLLMALGLAVGFFTGKMLLGRTLRVFGKKSVAAFALLLAVIAGSLVLTKLDIFGITRYVPEADQVESAAIYGTDRISVYRDNNGYERFEITDREELLQLQDLHGDLVKAGPVPQNEYSCKVMVQYWLKDGTSIKRTYWVDTRSSEGQGVKRWLSDARYIFQLNDPQMLYDLFERFYVNWSADKYGEYMDGTTETDSSNKEQLDGLLDAILADCAAGNMAQEWAFHLKSDYNEYSVETYQVELLADEAAYDNLLYDTYRFRYVAIWRDSVNTNAYLDGLFQELNNK